MELQYIPPEAVDRMLSIANIVDVVSERVDLKKTGRNYSACCPFHTEKTPSFTVSEEKQFYHCFGCGAHGTALSFIMDFTGVPFLDAVISLAADISFDLTPYKNERRENPLAKLISLNDRVAQDYHRYLNMPGNMAQVTLEKRGISAATAEKFTLGYSLDKWDDVLSRYSRNDDLKKLGLIKANDDNRLYDVFRHRLMFPIRNRSGDVVAFGGRVLRDEKPKYLNTEESALFMKRETVYGLFENKQGIRQAGFSLVVEGYMDVVALSDRGVNNAVASMGTALTDVQLSMISRLSPRIVFCFDGDAAGQKAAVRSMEILWPIIEDSHRISYAMMPEGHDPDSFVMEHGKSAFDALVDASMPLSDFFFKHYIPEGIKHLEERLDVLGNIAKNLSLIKKAPAFQKMMLQDASRRLDIPHDLAETALTSGQAEPVNRPVQARHDLTVRSVTPVRKAITILTQLCWKASVNIKWENYPYIDKLNNAGVALMKEIKAIIDSSEEINTAGIVSRFREEPEKEKLLAKLLTIEIQDHYLAEGELSQILKNLNEEGRSHYIAALASKPFDAFTEEDKRLFNELGL